jgi:hypothetical protein
LVAPVSRGPFDGAASVSRSHEASPGIASNRLVAGRTDGRSRLVRGASVTAWDQRRAEEVMRSACALRDDFRPPVELIAARPAPTGRVVLRLPVPPTARPLASAGCSSSDTDDRRGGGRARYLERHVPALRPARAASGTGKPAAHARSGRRARALGYAARGARRPRLTSYSSASWSSRDAVSAATISESSFAAVLVRASSKRCP